MNSQKSNILDKSPDQFKFHTQQLKSSPDDIAPDGSRIYLLSRLKGGSMCIAELAVGQTSQAVKHKTIEEIWYVISGEGEIWRKMGKNKEVTPVSENISITIPHGCEFQFRNTGKDPLRILIVTIPPWPGPDESIEAENYWI